MTHPWNTPIRIYIDGRGDFGGEGYTRITLREGGSYSVPNGTFDHWGRPLMRRIAEALRKGETSGVVNFHKWSVAEEVSR